MVGFDNWEIVAEQTRPPLTTVDMNLKELGRQAGWRRQTEATDFGQPTAAVSRWRISALSSRPLPVPGVGRARWRLELLRVRAGESADFEVDSCDAKGRLALSADLADRSAATKTRTLGLDAAARNAGVRIGMPASKAQVLVPGLVNLEMKPIEDVAALERLALWALRYAPLVAPDPPDGLIIDTSGADHLHGGEEAMLKSLVSRMEESGIAARAAVADAWGDRPCRRSIPGAADRRHPIRTCLDRDAGSADPRATLALHDR